MAKQLKLMYDFEKDARVGDLVRIVDTSTSFPFEVVGFFQGVEESVYASISQYNPPSPKDGEGVYRASLHNVWKYEILRRAKQGEK